MRRIVPFALGVTLALVSSANAQGVPAGSIDANMCLQLVGAGIYNATMNANRNSELDKSLTVLQSKSAADAEWWGKYAEGADAQAQEHGRQSAELTSKLAASERLVQDLQRQLALLQQRVGTDKESEKSN